MEMIGMTIVFWSPVLLGIVIGYQIPKFIIKRIAK